MPLRTIILEEVERVTAEQDKPLLAMTDETTLVDSGLDSLCFAIIVARLEDILGVDPFDAKEDFVFPVTVGEFIQLYERAVQ